MASHGNTTTCKETVFSLCFSSFSMEFGYHKSQEEIKICIKLASFCVFAYKRRSCLFILLFSWMDEDELHAVEKVETATLNFE